MQLLPGQYNRSDHLAHTGSDLPQFPISERTKYCSQASLLVRPLQGSCFQWMAYKTKENGKKRKNSFQLPPLQAVQQEGQDHSPQSPEYQAQMPGLDTKGISLEFLLSRLNFLLLLYLFLKNVVNFTITIFLSLFLSPLLFFFFLCYNPFFYLPITLSAPSHPLFPCLCLPLLSFCNLSPHYCSILNTHHLVTSLLYHCTYPHLPAIPDTTPSITTVEMHLNTHKSHKTQQPPYIFPHPSPFCSPPTPLFINIITKGFLYIIGKQQV
jgi:hypothetical protein